MDALAALFTNLVGNMGGQVVFAILISVLLLILAVMAFGVGYGLTLGGSAIAVIVGFAMDIPLLQYLGLIFITLIIVKFVIGLTGG